MFLENDGRRENIPLPPGDRRIGGPSRVIGISESREDTYVTRTDHDETDHRSALRNPGAPRGGMADRAGGGPHRERDPLPGCMEEPRPAGRRPPGPAVAGEERPDPADPQTRRHPPRPGLLPARFRPFLRADPPGARGERQARRALRGADPDSSAREEGVPADSGSSGRSPSPSRAWPIPPPPGRRSSPSPKRSRRTATSS